MFRKIYYSFLPFDREILDIPLASSLELRTWNNIALPQYLLGSLQIQGLTIFKEMGWISERYRRINLKICSHFYASSRTLWKLNAVFNAETCSRIFQCCSYNYSSWRSWVKRCAFSYGNPFRTLERWWIKKHQLIFQDHLLATAQYSHWVLYQKYFPQYLCDIIANDPKSFVCRNKGSKDSLNCWYFMSERSQTKKCCQN